MVKKRKIKTKINNMIEIKIDKKTLPKDGQKVKWQTYHDINNEIWKEGTFNQKEGIFCVGFDDNADKWDLALQVHHWESFYEGAFRQGTDFMEKPIDDQDLIRLGWKQKDREWWMQDFVLTGQLQYHNVTIEKYEEDCPMGEWTHWRDTVFRGKLKNRNDLQKIMDFLGIKTFIDA